jgi:cytochrome c553
MSRFTMALLAAAATAVTATALVALPAIGDSGTKGTDKNPDLSGLAACLATHGLPGAPTTGRELKQWLAGKDSDAVGAAMDACKDKVPEDSAPGPDAATVIACVRSHGIDAPTAPADFKR